MNMITTQAADLAGVMNRSRPGVIHGFNPIGYGLALLLIILLLSIEASLQTSIVWDRSEAWTPWLYKIGPFSIADFVIISISLVTVLMLLRRGRLVRSCYLNICALAWGYLGIGILYNLFVFTWWKTVLYDLKVVLYLTMPYLFLQVVGVERIRRWLAPPIIFVYVALAGLGDLIIVHSFGQVEYPSFLGLPVIPPLVPLSLLIVGALLAPGWRYRLMFIALLAFEVFNTFNRLSLGLLFQGALALGLVGIFRIGKKQSPVLRASLILIWLVGTQIIYMLMLDNPFQWGWLSVKADGANTRHIQMENVLLNFNRNIPGFIGKGLGSTWFEIIPVPEDDIYSVGTSVGVTSKEAMAMPVKFIFNLYAAGVLYKWGILGIVLLIGLISYYYSSMSAQISRLRRAGLASSKARWLAVYLLVGTILIFENFTYIGILKTSLMTSLMAFYVEHQIKFHAGELQASLLPLE